MAESEEQAGNGILAPLRLRNYRLFASGQALSLVGTWMQRVAQDWLVLELSGGSAVALGTAAALQFGPTLLLSLWGGHYADRHDKRRLLFGIQCGLGGSALLLGLLDVTKVVGLGQVYLLCVVLGVFSALDSPVRQSLAGELVGRALLTRAVAINSMMLNTARVVGPALAGVVIATVGTGWVFLINAGTFVAVLTGLALIRPTDLPTSRRSAGEAGALRSIAAGLREVRGRPDLVLVLVLVLFVSTFGINFFMTLALVARNVFARGPESYGLLTAALAVGCLGGVVVVARRRPTPGLRTVVVAAVVFGVCEIAVGVMPTYPLTALLLVPTGLAQLVFTTAANTTVQLGVVDSMRGRVMGLYMLVLLGGTPLGGPVLGWIASSFGGQAALWGGGLVSLLSAAVVGLISRSWTPRGQTVAPETPPAGQVSLTDVTVRWQPFCDTAPQWPRAMLGERSLPTVPIPVASPHDSHDGHIVGRRP